MLYGKNKRQKMADFNRERKFFSPPSLRRIWFLLWHWHDEKTMKDVQSAYKLTKTWHDALHEGDFETCGAEVCVDARQLKVKASDYFIKIPE